MRVPRLLWFGCEDLNITGSNDRPYVGRYNIMINELGGQTIRDYRDKQFGGKLPLKETFMCAIAMISCLEALHNTGYIHRSIHSRNFLLPKNPKEVENGLMYLIDLEKTLCIIRNGKHIPFQKRHPDHPDLMDDGRINYLSSNGHECCHPTRRDDLEALGFLFLMLHLGKVPWSNKYHVPRPQVKFLKKTPLAELVKDIHESFQKYLDHTQHLEFDETPDYAYLKSLFAWKNL